MSLIFEQVYTIEIGWRVLSVDKDADIILIHPMS
jgi:hypothetical protein